MAERTTQSWMTTPHFFLCVSWMPPRFKQWFAQAETRADREADIHRSTGQSGRDRAAAASSPQCILAEGRHHHARRGEYRACGRDARWPTVPVIPHADDLSLSGIARHRAEIVARAQTGKLRLTDLQGGTFTISNLGMYGIDAFTPSSMRPRRRFWRLAPWLTA